MLARFLLREGFYFFMRVFLIIGIASIGFGLTSGAVWR